MVERAGGSFGKKLAYISLTTEKSAIFFKKIVVLTTLDISIPASFSMICIFVSTCLVAVLMSLMISPVAGSIGN